MMMISLDLGFFSFVSTAASITSGSVAKRINLILICAFLFTLRALFIQLLLLGLGAEDGYQKLDTRILQALELYI